MDLQNMQTAVDIGASHHHLTIETAGAQEGGIEDFRAVRRCQNDDALVGVKAIHFRQQLVQGLLALVVVLQGADAARLAHGIQLINKDDTGGFLLRLLEQIPYSRRADPDKHLDKVRAAEAKKRYPGLTRHRPGQERFARAWRADQQDSFGNATTQRNVLLWLPQEIDNLLEFLFSLLGVCKSAKVTFLAGST